MLFFFVVVAPNRFYNSRRVRLQPNINKFKNNTQVNYSDHFVFVCLFQTQVCRSSSETFGPETVLGMCAMILRHRTLSLVRLFGLITESLVSNSCFLMMRFLTKKVHHQHDFFFYCSKIKKTTLSSTPAGKST